jgi:hypothetical protein
MSYTWQNVQAFYKQCDNNADFLKKYPTIGIAENRSAINTDIQESSDQINELLHLYSQGLLVTTRLGCVESSFLCKYLLHFPVKDHLITAPDTIDSYMKTNAGLYYSNRTRRTEVLDWWCRATVDLIKHSTYTSSYNFLNNDLCLLAAMNMKCRYYNYGYLYKLILQKSEGQRILYIGNAVDSIRAGYARGLQTFWTFPVSNFTLECIKTPQTTAGMEYPHDTMIETCEAIQREISRCNFDTAILGCGAYGPPLTNFIRTALPGKNAIYLGSDCFKMFGITVPLWKWEEDPSLKTEFRHDKLIHVVELLPAGCKNHSEKKYWRITN